MRRMLAVVWIFGLLSLSGTAMAQEKDQPQSEPGTVEPARPYFVDVSVSEVIGNDRGQVAIGEPTQVVLHATNTSGEPATGVTVKIAATPNATISPSTVTFGDLKAEGGTADRRVTVTIAGEKDCQDYTGWVGTLTSSLGEQEIEFVGGDGDGIPEPGETLQVYVSYRNNGRDAATNVRATLESTSEGVTVSDPFAIWGTIPAGAVGRATDPFEISIASDAPMQENGCSWDGGEVIVDDGDAPPPDQPVSSDGSSTGTGSAGSSSGSPGSGSAGASGSADGTATSTVAPDEAPDRAQDEAPEPRPYQEPAPQDAGVTVVGQMRVTADEVSFEETISNQMVCLMAEGRPSGEKDGSGASGDRTAEDMLRDDVIAGVVRPDTDAGRGSTIAIAVLLLAMVMTQLGWRIARTKAQARTAMR
jgi:hypothetical protein